MAKALPIGLLHGSLLLSEAETLARKERTDQAQGFSQVRPNRPHDLRSTYATRLSAGGVADEWVTQMLRQTDAQVFKKYSQMKLQMKREALEKLNRRANEMAPTADDLLAAPMCTVAVQ